MLFILRIYPSFLTFEKNITLLAIISLYIFHTEKSISIFHNLFSNEAELIVRI